MSPSSPLIDAAAIRTDDLRYSFCSLVTRWDQYEAMVAAMKRFGFDDGCEFLYLDNAEANRFDAYSGYNHFLQVARGTYVVLCHQDILPIADGREALDRQLSRLDALDDHWACCGNAGADEQGRKFFRITDPYRTDHRSDGLPAQVMSLDENFIVVKKEANLALSRDLRGFHWYGSDLCILADILGWRSYVIDFHLQHTSAGKMDASYGQSARALRAKYGRAFRPRRQYSVTRLSVSLSRFRLPDLGFAVWRARRWYAGSPLKAMTMRVLGLNRTGR